MSRLQNNVIAAIVYLIFAVCGGALGGVIGYLICPWVMPHAR